MKNYNTVYYLLFVLLVMGAFSSMAQNDYGNSIMGGVGIAFALLFGFQTFRNLINKEGIRVMSALESLSLTFLAGILAMRVLYFHFNAIELILAGAGVLLVFVYGSVIVQCWKAHGLKNQKLAFILITFYTSIILYVLTVTLAPFFPSATQNVGMTAFVLLLAILIGHFIIKNLMVDGENVTILGMIARLRDRSLVLMTVFLLFTIYTGLTRLRVIPEMYSDDYPQVYYQMVRSAEEGKEKRVNGTYRHEAFKKAYDAFVERNRKGE